MISVRRLPAFFCILVLAAHFFRAHNLILAASSVAAAPLIFLKSPWTALLIRAFLFVASIEWTRTTLVLIMQRESLGVPWMRMAVILCIVALFTVGASLIFPHCRQHKHEIN